LFQNFTKIAGVALPTVTTFPLAVENTKKSPHPEKDKTEIDCFIQTCRKKYILELSFICDFPDIQILRFLIVL
jgi:hypothetical protein